MKLKGRAMVILTITLSFLIASSVIMGQAVNAKLLGTVTDSSGAVVLDPGAIELRRQDGSLVDALFNISLGNGKTVASITFAGTEFVGGSLADGSYTLTVRRRSRPARAPSGRGLGPPGPPGGNRHPPGSRRRTPAQRR